MELKASLWAHTLLQILACIQRLESSAQRQGIERNKQTGQRPEHNTSCGHNDLVMAGGVSSALNSQH